MKVLIVGCGYLGLRAARAWLAAGNTVQAITRSDRRAAELAAEGIVPLLGDIVRRETLPPLPEADVVLFAVGYDSARGVPIERVYVDGLRHVLAALPATTGRLIYISSTGVYGDAQGEWIDEQTECRPQRAGGRACLAAEQALAEHPLGARSVVLRLAGIYGPGRLPRLDALRRGEAIAAPAEGALNLIHVDDAVRVVLAAAARAPLPRLYVVSDGAPAPRRAYYEELARLAGAPAPEFVAPPPESPAAERAAANKRVSNRRLLRELGVTWRYPTFRAGLAGLVPPLATG